MAMQLMEVELSKFFEFEINECTQGMEEPKLSNLPEEINSSSQPLRMALLLSYKQRS